MKTKTMSALEQKIRKEIKITLLNYPEDMPFVGNCMASGDDAVDREAEKWIRRQLDGGNDWAWCRVEVRGTWRGLEAVDHLGGCSYKSAEDFQTPGGYWDDMKEIVIAEILANAQQIRRA